MVKGEAASRSADPFAEDRIQTATKAIFYVFFQTILLEKNLFLN